MRKTVLLIVFLMVVAMILLFVALTAPRQQKKTTAENTPPTPTPIASTVLTFNPRTVTVDENGIGSVSIEIDTGYNQVTGVQLELGFDQNTLINVKATPGTFLPKAVVLLENTSVAGRYSYMLGLPLAGNPVNGKGTVATVQFQANPLRTPQAQTILTIMPKSLITSLGVEGSVLKKADTLTILLPQPTTTVQTPTGTLVNPTTQQ